MAETDLERLVVTLEAQSVKLDRSIAASAALVDRRLAQIEARTDLMTKRVTTSFGKAASGVNSALATIGIGLSAAAVIGFVDKVTTAAEELKKLSVTTGISTDALQEWAISASHVGVSQEDLNTGLNMFSKNLGEAALGTGNLKKVLDALHISTKGDVQTTLLKFADALRGIKSDSERAAIAQTGFGRNAAAILPFINQGSDAIKRQGEEFKKTGQIISSEGIDKLDQLGTKWKDVQRQLNTMGAKAITGAADEFDRLKNTITSQEFETALQRIGKIMADIAVALVKMAPYLPALAGAFIGARVGGLPGAIIGATAGDVLARPQLGHEHDGETQLQQLQRQAQGLQQVIGGRTLFERMFGDSGLRKKAIADLAEVNAQIAKLTFTASKTTPAGGKPQPVTTTLPANLLGGGSGGTGTGHAVGVSAEQLAAEERARQAALARIGVDVARANRDLIVEQDQTNVQLLLGQTGYYAAVEKLINDQLAAKLDVIQADRDKQVEDLAGLKLTQTQLAAYIALIDKEADAKRKAAQEQAKQDHDAAGSGSLMRQGMIDGDKQIQQYKDETAALGLVAGAAARLAFIQAQLNAAKEKGITLTKDEIAAIYKKADAIGKEAQANADATIASQRSIQVQDELRQGLEDVGAAGLHGFKSMKDAASQFLEQLAEMILRLYVLKPLLESLFGQQGTNGGGLLGGLLGGIFGGGKTDSGVYDTAGFSPTGFAGGTNSAPGGLALVGEKGPELVNLPRGSQVIPNSALRMVGGSGTVTVVQPISFDLRGAVMTSDLLKQMNAMAEKAKNDGAALGAQAAWNGFGARTKRAQLLGT